MAPLGVFSQSKIGAFAVLWYGRKNMTGDCVLRTGNSQGEKKNSSLVHLIHLFKISDEHPCLFYMGAPSTPAKEYSKNKSGSFRAQKKEKTICLLHRSIAIIVYIHESALIRINSYHVTE